MLMASSRLPLFLVADTAVVAIAAAWVLLDDDARDDDDGAALTFPQAFAAVVEPGMILSILLFYRQRTAIVDTKW